MYNDPSLPVQRAWGRNKRALLEKSKKIKKTKKQIKVSCKDLISIAISK